MVFYHQGMDGIKKKTFRILCNLQAECKNPCHFRGFNISRKHTKANKHCFGYTVSVFGYSTVEDHG